MTALKHWALPSLCIAVSLAMATPAAQADCDRQGFSIAVDIGHTAQSPGAVSARGLPEFMFNMALGRDVVTALQAAGFNARPIIVEGTGKDQLSRRVAEANAQATDLLISIHHDSVQEKYLTQWRFAGEKQRYADRFSGFSIFVSRANPRFEASIAFARALGRNLQAAGQEFSTHHAEKIPGENREMLDAAQGVFEFRNLRVLKETQTPAVLLEAGLIVNRTEELALATPSRRNATAQAIVAAATAMCAAQLQAVVLR